MGVLISFQQFINSFSKNVYIFTTYIES